VIAKCQFCQALIEGPHVADDAVVAATTKQWAYRQLSMLVAVHMSSHKDVAGVLQEVIALAGGVVAMRYVELTDAGETERIGAADRLAEFFASVPAETLVGLD
jgi:hypothetical protein